MMADLETITSEELVEEIQRRFSRVLIVVEDEKNNDSAQSEATYYFSGSLSAAVGLAERAKHYLLTLVDYK